MHEIFSNRVDTWRRDQEEKIAKLKAATQSTAPLQPITRETIRADVARFAKQHSWYKHLEPKGSPFKFKFARAQQVRNGMDIDVKDFEGTHVHFRYLNRDEQPTDPMVHFNCFFRGNENEPGGHWYNPRAEDSEALKPEYNRIFVPRNILVPYLTAKYSEFHPDEDRHKLPNWIHEREYRDQVDAAVEIITAEAKRLNLLKE